MRIKDTTQVPIVLVGNKSDLEDDRAVSRARAFQVSQTWGRVPYYETSARRRANVDEVFRDLCRQIIRRDMEMQKNGRGMNGAADKEDEKRRGKKKNRRRGNTSACTIL